MRRFQNLRRAHRGRRKSGAAGINLISLMDIFTILVFFLLVNASDVEVLPGNATVRLPESLAEKKPEETLVIVVDERQILVQGRKIAELEAVSSSPESVIASLKEELEYQALKAASLPAGHFTGAVTIMGDKEIPYRILRKILITCADSKYPNISLAVQKKAVADG